MPCASMGCFEGVGGIIIIWKIITDLNHPMKILITQDPSLVFYLYFFLYLNYNHYSKIIWLTIIHVQHNVFMTAMLI